MSIDKHFDYADDFEIKPDTWNRYNWDKYPMFWPTSEVST